MRPLLVLPLLFLPLLPAALAGPAAAAPDGRGVAVVELFTSEGCSSCPPAESLLATLDKEARARGEPVYVLAFHVGYWDYIGWKDRFADPAFTTRQRAYAAALDGGRVYTPQMVVGGREAFVGSHAPTARAAVRRALASGGGPRVVLEVSRQARRITARVAPAPGLDERTVHLALVENDVVSNVTSGENAGRKLVHRGVVRALSSRPPGPGGAAATFELPRGVPADRLEVVAFAQRPATLRVDGAGRAPVPATDGS